MVFIEYSSGGNMIMSAMECRLEADVIDLPPITEDVDFSRCGFECNYVEPVFGKDGGADHEQDKTDILIQLLSAATSTFEMNLVNNDSGEIIPLINDTYGTFYDAGDLSQPLKAGYLIDWTKVLDQKGSGSYSYNWTVENFGIENTFLSHLYNLETFTPERADGTVRIETIHNGTIENGIDYNELDWFSSIRIKGRFGQNSHEFKGENYQNTSRILQQKQDSVLDTWTLQTDLIPFEISEPLLKDRMLANTRSITDYSVFNYNKIYRKVDVYPTEYADPIYFNKRTSAVFEIIFSDSDQGTVKRNHDFS